MASVTGSKWMLVIKLLFISSGVLGIALGLKISVPLVMEFCVSQVQLWTLWWSAICSWLKPPYLYVIVNGIIITIAASSRFNQNNSEKDQMEEQIQPRSKIYVDQRPVEEYNMKNGWDFDVEDSDFVYEKNYREKEVEKMILEDESNVAVEDDRNRENEFDISESEWIPPTRTDSSEIPLVAPSPPQKPAFSSRFSHRKPVKTNPEDVGNTVERGLRVAKPIQYETLENTWKMIMERKAIPPSVHLKKSDMWENHGNVEASTDLPLMKKSETFQDRTNFLVPMPYVQVSPSSVSRKLRKDPSLSQEELNSRVEAFIQKFNDDMRETSVN